jgi:hypothetical protein
MDAKQIDRALHIVKAQVDNNKYNSKKELIDAVKDKSIYEYRAILKTLYEKNLLLMTPEGIKWRAKVDVNPALVGTITDAVAERIKTYDKRGRSATRQMTAQKSSANSSVREHEPVSRFMKDDDAVDADDIRAVLEEVNEKSRAVNTLTVVNFLIALGTVIFVLTR